MQWLDAAGAVAGDAAAVADGRWYPDQVDAGARAAIADLYGRYADELAELAALTRDAYRRYSEQGLPAHFSDVEGELVYMLAREQRPDVVWEMSPAAGWSTHYLLAALTRNEHGELHGFEHPTAFGGVDTESAIRGNLDPSLDAGRLTLHLGDARELAASREGAPDFLLVDSCHEAWFAEWWLHDLLPRVRGLCFVHDIVLPGGSLKHGQYLDAESFAVVEWLQRERVRAVPAAAVAESGVRPQLRSRAVALPSGVLLAVRDHRAREHGRPRARVRDADLAAIGGDHEAARDHLRQAEAGAPPHSPHALLQIASRYDRLAFPDEAQRLLDRVLAEHGDQPLWAYVASRFAVRLGHPWTGLRSSLRAGRNRDAPRWVRAMTRGRLPGRLRRG